MNTEDQLIRLGTELSACGARSVPLGMVLPENLSFESWAAIGNMLKEVRDRLRWAWADWVAFGERKYGQLKQFADARHIPLQTLENYGWVAKSVEISRRREDLDWSFYMVVAARSPADQVRWLEIAATEKLSVAGLRRRIRLANGERDGLANDGPRLRFGLKAALELSEWIRQQHEEDWSIERREEVKQMLMPIVEFCQRL